MIPFNSIHHIPLFLSPFVAHKYLLKGILHCSSSYYDMYIGLSLRHSSITKRILRGGLNLEIGKTLRKTSRVIIVVVQTNTKEIVGGLKEWNY